MAISPFAQLLLDTIRQRNLSLQEAAREIGVSNTSLLRWLKGQGIPTSKNVLKVAAFLGYPPADIFVLLGTQEAAKDDPRRDRLIHYFDGMKEDDKEFFLREARALYDLGESEDRAARVG